MKNSPGKPAPGRPRSQQALEAVMAAVQTLLAAEGYANLSMEGIAKAAGVGKPTLYRWWPNVPSIVMEMLRRQAGEEIAAPDTGSVRTDMLIFMGQTCKVLTERSGEAVRCLMAEAQLHPDFGDRFREQFIASRRASCMDILRRGIDRGELPADTDTELWADLFYGPIWYRLLNGHAALDERFVESLVALLPVRRSDAE